MRVIFLDIDGVLVTPRCLAVASGLRAPFDPSCVSVLNALIEKTGARICVISDWRLHHNLESLKALFVRQGIKGEIVGYTPKLNGWERSSEIKMWMRAVRDRGKPVSSYVIIDDREKMTGLERRFVRTRFEYGLTAQDALRASAHLLRSRQLNSLAHVGA